jgi:creatinine amidohydrolase
VLQVAHGPFQQLHDHPFTLIALENADTQTALIDRLESMLVPDRHRLLRLRSSLPAPLALLDHDVQLSALMIEALQLRPRDLMRWPGQGCDGPLYELGADIL